jgi:peptidoglycan/LPS O-acetylase OafA/YrhL
LRFINGLRGIAATLVMFYHLVGRTRIAALTDRGYLGVAILFVLSGFVITSVLAGRRMSLGFLGRFDTPTMLTQ